MTTRYVLKNARQVVCHLSSQRSTMPRWQSERVPKSYERRGTWAFFQEYRTS